MCPSVADNTQRWTGSTWSSKSEDESLQNAAQPTRRSDSALTGTRHQTFCRVETAPQKRQRHLVRTAAWRQKWGSGERNRLASFELMCFVVFVVLLPLIHLSRASIVPEQSRRVKRNGGQGWASVVRAGPDGVLSIHSAYY